MALRGLQDRIVVVTGAAAGIGFATVQRLLAEGARVALVDVDERALGRAVGELAAGERTLAVQADVCLEDDVARAFATVQERLGPVGGLHNNAGIEGSVAPLAELPADAFDQVVRVNLRGAFLMLREMLRSAQARGAAATIVNTASGAGLHAIPGFGAYSATKAGVVSLTRTAAKEYARAGIRVNAVVPGPVDTELFGRLPDELRAGAIAAIPQGRLGLPEEVAALTAWLLSDESPFVNGGIYAVDGGELA
jgi:NAD(P)-dependent dehydrogenase (short-subunit alcohol dehydrogenase family)